MIWKYFCIFHFTVRPMMPCLFVYSCCTRTYAVFFYGPRKKVGSARTCTYTHTACCYTHMHDAAMYHAHTYGKAAAVARKDTWHAQHHTLSSHSTHLWYERFDARPNGRGSRRLSVRGGGNSLGHGGGASCGNISSGSVRGVLHSSQTE